MNVVDWQPQMTDATLDVLARAFADAGWLRWTARDCSASSSAAFASRKPKLRDDGQR